MRGAARASKTDVHESKPSCREGNKKDKEEASDRRYFREFRGGHWNYPFSSRGIRCDRKKRINPSGSTAMPAQTNTSPKSGAAKNTKPANPTTPPPGTITKTTPSIPQT